VTPGPEGLDPTSPAGDMPGSETVAPTSPPPGDPAFWDAAVGEPLPKRRFPLLGKIGIGVAILLVVAIIAGFVIHVPYSTISPGEAVSLPPLVSVNGAKSFSDSRGDIRLLFVRERNDVSVWRYVQAHFDPDVDIIKDKVLNPQGRSQQQLNGEAQQQMADAKTAATVVALSAAGFKVTPAPGLTVSDLEVGLPAEKVLDFGDVITTVNGEKLTDTQQLQNVIQRSKVGDRVTLGVVRDGKAKTVQIAVGEKDERKLIGVVLTPRFNFPVRVNVNTASIGGPSAGLAMTLAILDDLTPGNLTGGKRVAVTGTIAPDGSVGEIGAINQKAVAARAAGAQLFIVPACSKTQDTTAQFEGCQQDLSRAVQRAGSTVKVIPVSTFAQALQALRSAGGDPVVTTTTAPRPT